MATFISKLLPQKSSGFVPSFSGCLNWCFRGSREAETPEEAPVEPKTADYGATKKPKEGIENGAAYAYDDAETSSDSDDEVLRRYQQSIRDGTDTVRRAPSERSVRSARSQRSSVSKATSKGHYNDALEPDHLLSMAERGEDTASEAAASVVPPSDYEVRRHDVRTRDEVAQSLAAGSTPSHLGSLEGVSVNGRSGPGSVAGSAAAAEDTTYENAGYQGDHTQGDISPDQPSATSSEKALSQYADTASMSVGDMDHDSKSGLPPKGSTELTRRYLLPQSRQPSYYGSLATLNTRQSFHGSCLSIASARSLQTLPSASSVWSSSANSKEHLFDVSDLQDREPALISKCGNLEVTFQYEVERTRMNITVHQAREIPSKDRGGANNSQVRLLLLPTKKVRHKTKIKPGENPEFQETFQMKVPLEEVNNMGVRFRLYGCERMRRERMIGESVVGFASLNLDQETTHMLTLEPRSNLSHGDSKLDVSSLSRSDSASSTQSMQHGGMPELLIGLAYNGTTGRLSVEVIKGSNFRNMAMNRAPDTYVKLTLMSPNGQEIARSKTSIRRGQPNPLYKETFMFQVALFQLPDVTLMTSVYNKRSMKRKEMIGWFSLGLNNSGEEELAHWNDMRESKGEQVCRWHVLLES